MKTSIQGQRFRRSQASQYLLEKWGISRAPGTLAKLAVTGCGPRFQLDGRVPLYPIDELDRFAESVLSPLKSSTSHTRKPPLEGCQASEAVPSDAEAKLE